MKNIDFTMSKVREDWKQEIEMSIPYSFDVFAYYTLIIFMKIRLDFTIEIK